MPTQSQRKVSVAVAFIFTGIAATMLATAYTYSKASSLLPRFAGWIFLILAGTEAVIQLRNLLRARREGSGIGDAAAEAELRRERVRGIKGMLWIVCMLLLLYVFGFLVATPLFIFAFLRISAGKSVVSSAITAIVATACVWLGFAELLEYKLYPGLLFR